jgi:hypothetical protein
VIAPLDALQPAGDVMLWVASAVTLVAGGSYLMATLRNLS